MKFENFNSSVAKIYIVISVFVFGIVGGSKYSEYRFNQELVNRGLKKPNAKGELVWVNKETVIELTKSK